MSTTTTAHTPGPTATGRAGRVGRAGATLAALVAALAALGSAPAHAAEETVSLTYQKIAYDHGDQAMLLPAVQLAGHSREPGVRRAPAGRSTEQDSALVPGGPS